IYGEEALHKIQEVQNHYFDLFQEYTSRVVASHESFQASSSNEVASVVEGDRPSSFDRFVASSSANVDPRSDLELYLEEGVLPRTASLDSLSWRKTNGLKFPTLQKIARDLLAIPDSTVASESAFSTSGRLIILHRSRLHPTTLEALMCARTWLWNEINGSSSSIDRVSCPTMLDEEEDIIV
uniref:Zinc finger BED domain-containing protein DAYSLEEPER-like n=2 Tax=Nicotiana sylvestris TaxID=4096 RepID=A0A1U7VWZ1_NICSY